MKFARTVTLIAAVMSLAVVPASAATAPSWKVAQLAELPAGGTRVPDGYVPTLSCPAAGNCVAAGHYSDTANVTRGLILNESRGVWKSPTTIAAPRKAAAAAHLTPYDVSCGSVGNCVVVGSYFDTSNNELSFAASEVGGRWRAATRASLPANALVTGQSSMLRAVACASAGYCSAVGTYIDGASPNPHTQGFALDEVRGVWRRVAELRVPADANINPFVNLSQLACAANGNCTTIGTYIDANNATHGLIVNEVRGVWLTGVALTLPGNANAYPNATLSSLACPGIAQCTAIGSYINVNGDTEGLSVSEVSGRWSRAVAMKMPVGAAANPHAFFYGFGGISCATVNNCATGGQYRDSAGSYEGFLLDEVNGVWRTAVALGLPGNSIMAGKNGGVVALSCVSPGNCSAGAAYLDGANSYQALTVDEVGGVWQTGVKVTLPPGATTVGVAGGVYGLVCAPGGQCTATGSYQSSPTEYQGFTLAAN